MTGRGGGGLTARGFPEQSARKNYILAVDFILVDFILVDFCAVDFFLVDLVAVCAKVAVPRPSTRPRAIVINFFILLCSP